MAELTITNAHRARANRRAVSVALRALMALIFRDAAVKFGGGPIAFVWTLIEPSIFIAIMLVMRVYVKNYAPGFGDSSLLFLLTGFLTFRMVRGTVNTSGKVIPPNRSLFDSGVIKPPDVVFSKVTVEYTIWLLILIIFFTAVREIIHEEVITHFQSFVIVLLTIYYFCLSLSMFNAVAFALFPFWRTIWKVMTVPLLFLSGVLYVPSTMPPEVQNIIYWNPFLHCIEAMRSASYLDYLTLYDPVYLTSFSTIMLIVSLYVERLYRRQVITTDYDKSDSDEENMF